MGRIAVNLRGPGAWRWWVAGVLIVAAVGATIWKVRADQSWTLTTQALQASAFANDGKYANQPMSNNPITATTDRPYINLNTGQPLNDGDTMAGADTIWCNAYLLYETDPDGRPVTYPVQMGDGSGFTAYHYNETNPTYTSSGQGGQSGFVQVGGWNILDGIVGGGATWGGRYRLVAGQFSTPDTYGGGSFTSGLVHWHQATNSGSIRIICRSNGAPIDTQITGFPFPQNHTISVSDHSNFGTGVTFNDLPGGAGQDFYIQPWGHILLNVPVGGYAVYTISDGQVSGGASMAINPTTAAINTNITVTVTGTGTAWTANTRFNLTGGYYAGITSVTRSSDYQTVTLTMGTGSLASPVTIYEDTDSATATLTLTDPNATPSPSPTPTPSPSPSGSPSPSPSPTAAPSSSPSPAPSGSPKPSPTPCPSGDTTCVPGANPVDTNSFWQQLFVPSTTTYAQWSDLKNQFAAWGPAGYCTSFLAAWNNESWNYCQDCACAPQYPIRIAVGTSGAEINTTFDLSCTTAKSTNQKPGLGSVWGDMIATIRPYEGYAVYIMGLLALVKMLMPRIRA